MQSDKSLLSRAMLRCSLTSRSNVSANRMQSDKSLLSRAMLRCSLTSRMQRYNTRSPKSKFFSLLISHFEKFSTPPNCCSALYLWAFSRIFHMRKKMKSGYNILSFADSQNVRSSNVWPHPNTTTLTPFCYSPLVTVVSV